MLKILTAVTLSTVVSVACVANDPEEQAASNSDTDGIVAQAPGASGNGQAGLSENALEVAADYLRVTPGELTVVQVQAVDWPDSSLGCPKPGMSYMQVITPGHRVTIQYGNQLLDVHMAEGRGFVCDRLKQGLQKVAPPAELKLSISHFEALAKKDLAHRLNVDPGTVSVIQTEAVKWTDTSLGCPVPGEEYIQSVLPGHILTIGHNGRQYTYHTDGARLFPCPPVASE